MSRSEGSHELGAERTVGWLERLGAVIEVDGDEGNTPTVPAGTIEANAPAWEAGMREFQVLRNTLTEDPGALDRFLDRAFSPEAEETLPPHGSTH